MPQHVLKNEFSKNDIFLAKRADIENFWKKHESWGLFLTCLYGKETKISFCRRKRVIWWFWRSFWRSWKKGYLGISKKEVIFWLFLTNLSIGLTIKQCWVLKKWGPTAPIFAYKLYAGYLARLGQEGSGLSLLSIHWTMTGWDVRNTELARFFWTRPKYYAGCMEANFTKLSTARDERAWLGGCVVTQFWTFSRFLRFGRKKC